MPQAESEKKGCYPFFEGFRPPIPACAEPNGDGRSTVSRRASPVISTKRKKTLSGLFSFAVEWMGLKGGIRGMSQAESKKKGCYPFFLFYCRAKFVFS